MFDKAGSRAAAEESEKREIRIRRLGMVEELAAVAAFLCSERTSYLTGTAVRVDGGLTQNV